MINKIQKIFNNNIYNINYLLDLSTFINMNIYSNIINPILITKKNTDKKRIFICTEFQYNYFKSLHSTIIRKNCFLIKYNKNNKDISNVDIYINENLIKSILRLKLLNKLL